MTALEETRFDLPRVRPYVQEATWTPHLPEGNVMSYNAQHRAGAAPASPGQEEHPYAQPWPAGQPEQVRRPWWRRKVAWLLTLAGLAVIAVGALLAVQGGTGAGTAATAANVKACQDYRTQGISARKVAHPELSDIARWTDQVAGDAAEASPGSQLRRDLSAWAANPVTAHSRILADCSAVGVTAG